MKKTTTALLAFALAVPAFAADSLPPVRDFQRFAEYESVKLSPGGEYLAISRRVADQTSLGFVRIADGKGTGGLNFGQYNHVADFYWVGPKRIVSGLAHSPNYFFRQFLTGELMAIDADGGNERYLFGQRGGNRLDTRIGSMDTNAEGFVWMVDPLPQDPTTALVMFQPWNKDFSKHEVFRLNVNSGERHREFLPPADRIDQYLTDEEGRVRYASGVDADHVLHSFVRNPDDTWAPLATGKLAGYEIEPLNFSKAENAVWLRSDEGDGDRFCLVRQDVAKGLRVAVACDSAQSLSWTLDSADRSHPIAVVFEAGKPEMRVLAPESAEGKVISTLVNTFAGKGLDHFSMSLDGTKILFRAFSDRDPGSYFLLDVQAGKLKRVLAARPWIKPEQMAERRPIEFKNRTGTVLHGYLTLPNGREAKGLPLVVMPHTESFWARDNWEWDADPQLLASRGYAVLQVNFRGSEGYGMAFIEAGRKQWGTGMIDDITDGLRFVLNQGIADPARVCVFGSGYGGYAAMMSAVREPDAYRCVVANAGVYDLSSFRNESDIAESWSGMKFLQDFVGMTPEIKKEQSPLSHIERLKAPVFIAHGEEDKISPYSQAKQLRSALEERKIAYEWFTKAREEHGFYDEGNRVEFYEKMLAFLDKYIGKPNPAAAAK